MTASAELNIINISFFIQVILETAGRNNFVMLISNIGNINRHKELNNLEKKGLRLYRKMPYLLLKYKLLLLFFFLNRLQSPLLSDKMNARLI